MRVHKFLTISEYAPEGYTFVSCTDESYEWMNNSPSYRFVDTTVIAIDEHREWLAGKGLERIVEIEQEANEATAKKMESLKSKFLLLGSE
jgi:hypothetical protein